MASDFAEYYGITDMDRLPVEIKATLAAGLRRDSRSVMEAAGEKITLTETLLALAVDDLNTLIWMRSEDGGKGRNRPASILKTLINGPKPRETKSFRSTEAFENYWQRAVEERTHHGK